MCAKAHPTFGPIEHINFAKVFASYSAAGSTRDYIFFDVGDVRVRIPSLLAQRHVRTMASLLRPGSWSVQAAIVKQQLVLFEKNVWRHTILLTPYAGGMSVTE